MVADLLTTTVYRRLNREFELYNYNANFVVFESSRCKLMIKPQGAQAY